MSAGFDMLLTKLATYAPGDIIAVPVELLKVEDVSAPQEFAMPAGELQQRLLAGPGGNPTMPEPCTKKVKVATAKLNLRAQPTMKAAILTQLSNGTEVEIVVRSKNPSADGHEWLQQYNAPYGWIARDLTSDANP